MRRERWAAPECLCTCRRSERRRERESAGGKEDNKKIVLLKIQHSPSLRASAGEKISSAGLSASLPVRATMTRPVRTRNPAGVCPHIRMQTRKYSCLDARRVSAQDTSGKMKTNDTSETVEHNLAACYASTHTHTDTSALCVRVCLSVIF